jgi:hypothetical protein
MRTIRRLTACVATALGLIAVAAGPASAGTILNNHCRPHSTR